MINPNKEQLEAIEAQNRKSRLEFMLTLSPEDQLKFQAIEQAEEILKAAGVKYYLFPYLPTKFKKEACWLYHSLTAVGKTDDNGNINYKDFAEVVESMYSQIFQMITASPSYQAVPLEQKVLYVGSLLFLCNNNEYTRLIKE